MSNSLLGINTSSISLVKRGVIVVIPATNKLKITVIITSFPGDESHYNNISTKNETMALEQITYLEGIIETRLKIEEEIKSDVKITYNQEESGVIKYSLLEIYIEESQNIDKSKIEKIASEYLDCQVIVYV